MSSRERYPQQTRTDRSRYVAPGLQDEKSRQGSGRTTPSEMVSLPYYQAGQSTHARNEKQRSKPWWKRPTPLLWTAAILIVLILSLALGVYFGLLGRTEDNGDIRLPSMNLLSDQAGMEEQGSFFTSSEYSGYRISTLFAWTAGGFTLGAAGAGTQDVDLLIDTSAVQQPMDGFGSSLTDSSCYLLHTLKVKNETQYNQTLEYLFHPRFGMDMMRVPIGSSDYSAQGIYSYADSNATAAAINAGNTTSLPSPLAGFNLERAEEYILPVLRDAVARRSDLKIWLSPWSPPAWMKTPNNGVQTMNGGQLIWGSEELYSQYLFRTVQAYTAAGIRPYAVTVQNEPSNGAESYPSNWMSPSSSALIAGYLRTTLDEEGFGDVKLFANDDNWSDWPAAAEAIQSNTSAWAGVAWHGYNGNYTSIQDFNTTISNVSTPVEQHLTEITTTDNSRNQWWSTRFWLRNMYFGPVNMGVRSVMSWNVALDSAQEPYIETAPCLNCLGTFLIDSPSHPLSPPVQGSNAQFITHAHFSAAVSNLTSYGGGSAYRISAGATDSASNSVSSCLTMSAFAAPWNTTRLATSAMKRIGLVIVNDCGSRTNARVGVEDRQGNFGFSPGLTTLIFNV